MNIYDKASWQLDGGMDLEVVIKHFELMFDWLNEKNFLSDDGKEMLEIGIDDSISLNENHVTSEGKDFLDSIYDKLISESDYDVTIEKELLDKFYRKI